MIIAVGNFIAPRIEPNSKLIRGISFAYNKGGDMQKKH